MLHVLGFEMVLVCLTSYLLEWVWYASCFGFWNGFVMTLSFGIGNGVGVPQVFAFVWNGFFVVVCLKTFRAF